MPGYRSWPLVALVIATVVVAASPATAVDRDGLYRGSTSQDRPIRFEVDGTGLRDVRLTVFHESCNLVVVATSGDLRFLIDDNAFVMRFFGNGRRDKVVVRGEFTSRNRARGTLRSVQDNRVCRDVVRGRWRAERAETTA